MCTKLSVLIAICLFCLAACSPKPEATESTSNAKPTISVDPATAATINGHIKFEGTFPKPQRIDMGQDPACGNKPVFDESLVANNGNLQNVFVYVKSGLNGSVAAGNEPVVIEQRGCQYHPHILGATVGQTVKIVNADDTTHNIHPMPTASKPWNESQLPKAEPIVKMFNQPELMIPIKCNQHPWMRMYLNVVDHPFFAVTGPDGTFEITGLPPGEYTLAAVHEKLGEQTAKIVLGPKESKAANFTFTEK